MAKLNDFYGGASGIGNEALLLFIDEVNVMRARSGNRMRYRPVKRSNGVLGMEEHHAIPRPSPATAYSERYSA